MYPRHKKFVTGAAPNEAAGFRRLVLCPSEAPRLLSRNRFLRHYADLLPSAVSTGISTAMPLPSGARSTFFTALTLPPIRRWIYGLIRTEFEWRFPDQENQRI